MIGIQQSTISLLRKGVIGILLCCGVTVLGDGSRNEVIEKDGVITIRITIDRKKEPKVKELEGTAMLRTDRQLRKLFQDLPRRYSVPMSVTRADFDSRANVYFYETVVRRKDVEDYIAQAKFEKQNAPTGSVKVVAQEKPKCQKASTITKEPLDHGRSVTKANATGAVEIRQAQSPEVNLTPGMTTTNLLKDSASHQTGTQTNSSCFNQASSTGSPFRVVDEKPLSLEEMIPSAQAAPNTTGDDSGESLEEGTSAEGAISILF